MGLFLACTAHDLGRVFFCLVGSSIGVKSQYNYLNYFIALGFKLCYTWVTEFSQIRPRNFVKAKPFLKLFY